MTPIFGKKVEGVALGGFAETSGVAVVFLELFLEA